MTASTYSIDYPKLREIDIRPHNHYGHPYLVFSDPLQITDKTLMVPQSLAVALAFCDGTRDVSGIRAAYILQYGVEIEEHQVCELLNALDEALMLDNERFEDAYQQTLIRYQAAEFRKPALAGPSYPSEPEQLHKLLDHYLAQTIHLQVDWDTMNANPGRGLVSPHIDYQRGGKVYAQSWARAEEAARNADLVIMFGTDHKSNAPFTLTKQNYATPFGILPTEQTITDALATAIERSMGEQEAYRGELRHISEHSLELVAVWLHHMRQGKPVEMVPILVGGFHHFIENGTFPKEDPLLNNVLNTLVHSTSKRNVLVVASGDLAHVGPAFGGKPLNAQTRLTLRHDDEELLNAMMAGDKCAFFESIRRVEDSNNVCGVSPIYLTISLLELLGCPTVGEQTGYATCPADTENNSVVTVGGMLFS
ncbi:AmmeMemoRadiSam system protein B [Chloroflexi bacterium TSY]|nr:AmmeMemoRadiSam system protein B [Chloroflexi bacterium TSY]